MLMIQAQPTLTNSPPDSPEKSAPAAFKSLSLEQLMSLDVTSVSRAPQPYSQAPAAIQVITGDEIHRSGASSLPEALRLADNLDIAQANSHDWAISARGFDGGNGLGNKLLVLIDGRAVYTPLYGGVEWEMQDYLLEDIDRIEVISGPGGTMWGANAVNGVINIETKSAKDTQGLYVESGGGNELQDFAAVRYGGTLASNVYFRVYGKYSDRTGEELDNGQNARDSGSMGQGGFRIDSLRAPETTVTLQGDYYSGGERAGTLTQNQDYAGGNILGRVTHAFSDEADMSLQLYLDRTYLSVPFDVVPSSTYESGFPASSLVDALNTCDLDFQSQFPLGSRQKIVCGAGYRYTHETDYDPNIVRFNPPVLDQNLFSAFAQDQITIVKNVTATVGTKFEHNDYTGIEVEPSGRLQWQVTTDQMIWGAVSRAVRTPSRYDYDLDVVSGYRNAPAPYVLPSSLLTGSSNFVSEKVIAYELGYRGQLSSKVSTSLSLYYNVYQDLRSISATPTSADYPYPYPDYFQNNLHGQTYGLEWSGNYQICDPWRLHVGYNLLKEHIEIDPGAKDVDGGYFETADPQQQFFVRSSLDLPQNIALNAGLRWVDRLHMVQSPTDGPALGTVPSYAEVNARIGWRANKHLELALVGENLLHTRHAEYGFPNAGQEQIVRSVFAKAIFTW
jgi:iron complex outermembrane recepter protein